MAGELPGEELAPEDAKRGFLGAAAVEARRSSCCAGPGVQPGLPDPRLLLRLRWATTRRTATRVGCRRARTCPAARGRHPPRRPVGRRRRRADLRVRRDPPRRSAAPTTGTCRSPSTRDGKPLSRYAHPGQAGRERARREVAPRACWASAPVARPAIIGVPEGGPAAAAGLETFDRIAHRQRRSRSRTSCSWAGRWRR